MFGKKKIVIGETYLFDVLNETNMANLVSLVTVVKKVKYNKYAVVSVNNGYVFETKAKYLTPYVDPEKATIVRCQYGTTEFDNQDIDYFKLINSMLETFEAGIKGSEDESMTEMLQDFANIRQWGDHIRNKIQQYIDISDYKDYIETLGNAYKNIKDTMNLLNPDNDDCPIGMAERPIGRSNFEYYFDQLVNEYNKYEIDLDNFMWYGQQIIKEHYPTNLLKNQGVLSKEETDSIASDIIFKMRDTNCVVFVIGMDDNNNWHLKSICYDRETSNTMELIGDLKKFIYDIYPELKSIGKCNPKYRFNVIAVSKREELEEEEEEENE